MSSKKVEAESFSADDDVVESLEQFRKRFQSQHTAEAYRRLRQACANNTITGDVIKFVTEGKEGYTAHLNAFWQNMGMVSALIGAIAVTVLLNPIERSEFLQNSDFVLSPYAEVVLTQLYFAFWTIASCSEICAVVVLTIVSVHFSNMMTDDDIIWFMLHWDFIARMLPQILLVVGIFFAFFGCAIGAFLIGNITSGIIVSSISCFASAMILPMWVYMLKVNGARGAEDVKRIKKQILERQ